MHTCTGKRFDWASDLWRSVKQLHKQLLRPLRFGPEGMQTYMQKHPLNTFVFICPFSQAQTQCSCFPSKLCYILDATQVALLLPSDYLDATSASSYDFVILWYTEGISRGGRASSLSQRWRRAKPGNSIKAFKDRAITVVQRATWIPMHPRRWRAS